MSEQTVIKLQAQERSTDKNPRQLRAEGILPVTVYGKGMESKSLQINTHEFVMAYKNNKEAVFELSAGKEKFNVKVQEAQIQYSDNTFLNVEFILA